MKHFATLVLLLNLCAGGVSAHQRAVKMTFSGTGGASAINLQVPDTASGEDNFAGNGVLGAFTYHEISAETLTPRPSSSCSGPSQVNYSRVAGAGVFRFQDGSLLKTTLTDGTDCIDFAAYQAHCTLTLKITGGTGRFKNASGVITLDEIVVPVLADFANNPVFYAMTGDVTGTISGVARNEESPDEQPQFGCVLLVSLAQV